MKKITIIVIALNILVGCKGLDFGSTDDSNVPKINETQKQPEKKEEPIVPPQPPLKKEEKKISSTDFQILINEKEFPNEYFLKINWPSIEGSISFFKNQENIDQINATVGEYKIELIGGEKFELSIEFKGAESSNSIKFQKSIVTPLDYIVASDIVLKQDLQFKGNRFFILNKATLHADTFNVDINVNKFISDRGTITSLNSGLKAAKEQHGRSGGNFNINTKFATGYLSVLLNGESGGDGKPGYRGYFGNQNCNGSNGGNGGDAGYFSFTSAINEKFEIDAKIYPGIFGVGGASGAAEGNVPPEMTSAPSNSCIRGNQNGFDGKDGKGVACYKLSSDSETICNRANGIMQIINGPYIQ